MKTATATTATTATTANKGALRIDAEKTAFDTALINLSVGGTVVKKAFQTATRYAIKAILYRKDTLPATLLYQKLESLESPHYRKLMLANFAAWCGNCNVEINTRGENIFYLVDKPCVVYSKEKGKKGWNIEKFANIADMKKTYETYFTNAIFASVKTRKREVKKTMAEKFIDMAKTVLDTARATKALPDDALWAEIPEEWQKVFLHIHELIKD